MANGFGFWDLLWLMAAGAGATIAVVRAGSRPGGRAWIIGLGATAAALGLWQLFAVAPAAVGAAFWALVVACVVQFCRAAARL